MNKLKLNDARTKNIPKIGREVICLPVDFQTAGKSFPILRAIISNTVNLHEGNTPYMWYGKLIEEKSNFILKIVSSFHPIHRYPYWVYMKDLPNVFSLIPEPNKKDKVDKRSDIIDI